MLPKKNKKSNQGEVVDEFDDMLAEFRAADLGNASSSPIARIAADAAPANAARTQAPEMMVPEATILAAITAGDLTRSRRWHRQVVRFSATIVCMAAELGSMAVMRCLVEELGADVDGEDDDGYTPVFVASRYGHLNLVRCLVKILGADVNKANARGTSPMYVAAQNGHLEVVHCLVEELGADVNQAMDDGITPMMIAAADGHVAIVRCLAREHGADINLVQQEGATALLLAAQNGHLNVVQCLVKNFGADVNQRNNNGTTALVTASYGKHEKVVKWLLKNGANAQAFAAPGTAVDASRAGGAPIEQTEYLEAKAHCSNPGCSGARLKKCTGCKQVRFCGQVCQLAHWKAHKVDCKASKNA
jgi:hypothetical protein